MNDQDWDSPCIIYAVYDKVLMRIKDAITYMNLVDTETDSPLHCYGRHKETENENLTFDIRV